MIRPLAFAALVALAAPALALKPPAPGMERVTLETSAGKIVLDLNAKKAPITTANFLRYVDQHRFDGTNFYRVAPAKGAKGRGFIQGGIQSNYTRMLPPIALEPSSKTGLKHLDGTISMARLAPNSATGDFTIGIGATPNLDANPHGKGDNLGFAAFGQVVQGMDVVRHILAMKTLSNAGSGAMAGQYLVKPVTITSAHRG